MHLYYIKKLGKQERGSKENRCDKPKRGPYILIGSQIVQISEFFPDFSDVVKNHGKPIKIFPLYLNDNKPVYVSMIKHNDHNTQGGCEARIYTTKYLGSGSQDNESFLEKDDIMVIRKYEDIFVMDCYPVTGSNGSEYQTLNEMISRYGSLSGAQAMYYGKIKSFEEKFKKNMPLIQQSSFQVAETIKSKLSDLTFSSKTFRDFVLWSYDYKCAVSKKSIQFRNLNNLQAAHIRPKSHEGIYFPSNGIALSRDLHWAFDIGLFTIEYQEGKYLCKVHDDVDDQDFKAMYHNVEILTPKDPSFQPNIEYLAYHKQRIFGGFKALRSLTEAELVLSDEVVQVVNESEAE